MTKRKSGKKVIFIIAIIVLVLCIGLISYFMFFNKKKTDLKIASQTEVIKYFNDNEITDYFNEKLNIDIEWIDYGSENVYEKIKEDASKDASKLPDAYLGISLYKDQMQAIAPDVFMDITNIVDSESKDFKKVIAEDTSRLSQMKIDDKIYSFPSLYQDFSNEYPQKVWINSEWLSKTESEMPTTGKELFDVLMKFKDSDLNGNNKKDEIPLGIAYKGGGYSTFGFIINSFITSDYDLSNTQGYLNVDNNGKVYSAVTDGKFKDALIYIKDLIDNDLVSKDIFTTGPDEFLKGSKSSEIYGVIAAQDINAIFNDAARSENYKAVPPLNSGNTATLVRRTPVKTGGLMVGRETKHHNLIIKLGDEMLSEEGTLTILYGKEGKGWNKADNRIEAMGGTETKWKIITDKDKAIDNTIIKDIVPYWYSAELQMSKQATADDKGKVNLATDKNWQGYLNKITKDTYLPIGQENAKNVYPEIVFTPEQENELSAEGNVRADVYDYLVETTRQFILGEKDIESNWDEFVETINSKGLKKIIEFSQQAYDSYSN